MDLISRQAAINMLIRESQADGAYGYLDAKSIDDALERMPSADVVEIVRCKECLMHGICRFEQGLGLDGFCSQGQRKVGDKI